jgi:hypothetical protein
MSWFWSNKNLKKMSWFWSNYILRKWNLL